MSQQSTNTAMGPKQRKKHYAYDEGLDEPAKLIEEEVTDIEEEQPADGNEPMEQVEGDKDVTPPIFEE